MLLKSQTIAILSLGKIQHNKGFDPPMFCSLDRISHTTLISILNTLNFWLSANIYLASIARSCTRQVYGLWQEMQEMQEMPALLKSSHGKQDKTNSIHKWNRPCLFSMLQHLLLSSWKIWLNMDLLFPIFSSDLVEIKAVSSWLLPAAPGDQRPLETAERLASLSLSQTHDFIRTSALQWTCRCEDPRNSESIENTWIFTSSNMHLVLILFTHHKTALTFSQSDWTSKDQNLSCCKSHSYPLLVLQRSQLVKDQQVGRLTVRTIWMKG